MQLQLGGRATLRSEINVIPMIDVLLVLIVIFMLLQGRFVIDVQLPPGDGTQSPGLPEIVLELRRDGGYAINGRQVALDELAGALEAIYVDRPRRVLFVKADRERIYQEVMSAVDLARSVGVEVIGYMP